MPIIDVCDLTFSYPDHDVLNNVNFSVEEGDLLGIIGQNGSGKSTLIKLILGLCEPSSGSILLQHNSKIGYVSQKATSFNSQFPATVLEVVCSGITSKLKKRQRIEVAKQAIKEVGLEYMTNSLVGQLSGGQQQRVFIARAICDNPDIIIFDEPTVGVDAASVNVISELIRRLNKKGITILMTNHDTLTLKSLATKLLIIDEEGNASLKEGVKS